MDSVKKKDTRKSAPNSSKKSETKQASKTPVVKNAYENTLPTNILLAVFFLCAGTALLVISIWPEGWVPELIRKLVCGLVGRIGFYVCIPVFFMLFYIHGFDNKHPYRMRTFCLAALVILCGCAAHLLCPEQTLPGGFETISRLFQGGVAGIESVYLP